MKSFYFVFLGLGAAFFFLLLYSPWWSLLAIGAAIFFSAHNFYRSRLRGVESQRHALQQEVADLHVQLDSYMIKEQKAYKETETAMSVRRDLLSAVNHEIRTPMNGMLGMTSLLADTPLNKDQREYVDTIRCCGENLLTVVNDITFPGFTGAGKRISVTGAKRKKENTKRMLSEDFAKEFPLRILVAEDNLINQKLIITVLAKMGYDAALAQDGKEVMEMTDLKPYDLILMDVQMPEIDGLEATRMLRQCLEKQPVIIAMTANVMEGDRDNCIQAGMDDYISKPVALDELLGQLEKWGGAIRTRRLAAM